MPSEACERLHVSVGDMVVVEVADDMVSLRPWKTVLKEIQEYVREKVPAGVSLVDELIAERRAERNVSEVVVDASAVLALMLGEKGVDKVEEMREESVISTVNILEALSRLVRHDVNAERAQLFLRQAFPNAIAFDRQQAETAAMIHSATRSFGLSYGDCACLALGIVRRAPVLTGDRRWKELDIGVKVLLFR
ncbi:MAG: type II toxin-antitoxin system VapC family toxin [Planctomycetaceae bacterium]